MGEIRWGKKHTKIVFDVRSVIVTVAFPATIVVLQLLSF